MGTGAAAGVAAAAAATAVGQAIPLRMTNVTASSTNSSSGSSKLASVSRPNMKTCDGMFRCCALALPMARRNAEIARRLACHQLQHQHQHQHQQHCRLTSPQELALSSAGFGGTSAAPAVATAAAAATAPQRSGVQLVGWCGIPRVPANRWTTADVAPASSTPSKQLWSFGSSHGWASSSGGCYGCSSSSRWTDVSVSAGRPFVASESLESHPSEASKSQRQVDDRAQDKTRVGQTQGLGNDGQSGEASETEEVGEGGYSSAGDSEEGEAEEEWYFEEEDEDYEAQVGDGLDGGGVVLGDAATPSADPNGSSGGGSGSKQLWGAEVLRLAEEVLLEPRFGGDLALYAFRVIPERRMVRVRLDKLSDMYGSPSADEIDNFLVDYHARVLQGEARGELPQDIQIEVSTPGAERVVRVPQDLLRFRGLPMYVSYDGPAYGAPDADAKLTRHEVLELVGVDEVAGTAELKLADVRVNRELLGKGRRLNKKQREWRVHVPFGDVHIARLYLDV